MYQHCWYDACDPCCCDPHEPMPCPQGATGPTGPQGEQGPMGPQGEPGPQGNQGPMGPQGNTGANGIDGISPTITVRSTITAQPGENAEVLDSGSPNHVLDFIIPRGFTGADGSMGATGPQGPQGPQGIQGPVGPQGNTGATGADGITTSGIEAYGGRYQSGTQLVFFTQPDTFIPVSLNTTLPEKNIQYPAANQLQITQTGDYEINYNILLNTSNAVTVAIAVRKNGDIIPQTRGSQTMAVDDTTTLSYDGRLSCSTFASLVAGDILELVISTVRTLPQGLDAVINGFANATLTVKRLDNSLPIR